MRLLQAPSQKNRLLLPMLLRKWHRSLGILTAFFLLSFVTTGLLLQHTATLGLDRHHVSWPAVLAWYGLEPSLPVTFRVGERWVSQAGGFLYFEKTPVPEVTLSELRGAVERPDGLWIAGDDKLWLLSWDGEVLEELSFGFGLPDIARGLAPAEGAKVVVRGLYGNWVGSPTDGWQPHTGTLPWTAPHPAPYVPGEMQQHISDHAAAHLLSWERLLQDLHSGRLFGAAGVLVADFAGLLLLVLAFTGLAMWLRGRGH